MKRDLSSLDARTRRQPPCLLEKRRFQPWRNELTRPLWRWQKKAPTSARPVGAIRQRACQPSTPSNLFHRDLADLGLPDLRAFDVGTGAASIHGYGHRHVGHIELI